MFWEDTLQALDNCIPLFKFPYQLYSVETNLEQDVFGRGAKYT